MAVAGFLVKTLMIAVFWFYWVHWDAPVGPPDTEVAGGPVLKSPDPTLITEANFRSEVLESREPVLVDFWAVWCAPCRVMEPIIEEIAEDFQGRARVGKLNIDEHEHLALRYGVRFLPTFLFFKDGQVLDQLTGLVSKETLAHRLERLSGDPTRLGQPLISQVGQEDR